MPNEATTASDITECIHELLLYENRIRNSQFNLFAIRVPYPNPDTILYQKDFYLDKQKRITKREIIVIEEECGLSMLIQEQKLIRPYANLGMHDIFKLQKKPEERCPIWVK